MLPVAILVLSTPVYGADGADANSFTASAGVKLWENTWESRIVVPTVFNQPSRQVVETVNSSSELAVIPQASLRYGNWLASVSTLTPTNYTQTASYGAPLVASRYEIDGNFGYYVLPSLALTAGYKELEQKFDGTFKWRGPTLGMSGTASLGRGFSLYGDMKVHLRFADGAGDTSRNALYELGESGIPSLPEHHCRLSLADPHHPKLRAFGQQHPTHHQPSGCARHDPRADGEYRRGVLI
jgi:hypothetical protein